MLKKSLIFLVVTIPVLVIFSVWLKLKHAPSAELFLELSLIFFALFAVLSLIHIFRSKSLSSNEKWMYAIAVVFLGWLGGLLYLTRSESPSFAVPPKQ